MSPHGVFQLPKSLASLSDAAASAWTICWGAALWTVYSSADTPALRASAAIWRPISSPQYTASELGTEVVDHRKSHALSWPTCSDSFAFNGLDAGSASYALSTAGMCAA